jgi:protocatechuate 3,4-dioxygenase beta subunit
VRGDQITDSNGAVTFKTIVPGWYSGRTIHIHVMIRTLYSSGSVLTEFTTQLFLDQTLINATSVSPYSSTRPAGHTSREDSLYSSSTQLTLTNTVCCAHNYRGTNNLAVRPEPVHAFEI